MFSDSVLATSQLVSAFRAAVERHQGQVKETFDDGRRVFARSILPDSAEVRRGDRVQNGVAMKAVGDSVWLHPYVFRQVCSNGAIMAQTVETRHIVLANLSDTTEAVEAIGEAVAACCREEVFPKIVDRMRWGCGADVDMLLTLMPLFSRAPAQLVSQIIEHYFRDGDRSRFGLANAVTAVARDVRDPDQKWDLEELGGGIAVGSEPQLPDDEAAEPAGAVVGQDTYSCLTFV